MQKEVDAVTKLYDYMLWMIPKLDKFPKNQKFLIGDRIESRILEILDLLIEAAYSSEKAHLLRAANLKLEQLRYLVRLSKDLQLLNMKAYEYSARAVNGVGVSIGGWLKSRKEERKVSLPKNEETRQPLPPHH